MLESPGKGAPLPRNLNSLERCQSSGGRHFRRHRPSLV